MTHSIFIDYFR